MREHDEFAVNRWIESCFEYVEDKRTNDFSPRRRKNFCS